MAGSASLKPATARNAYGVLPRVLASVPLKAGVTLLLCTALLSACVARTAVKTTTKAAKTVVKTTGKVAGAAACTATDLVIRDPRCKG